LVRSGLAVTSGDECHLRPRIGGRGDIRRLATARSRRLAPERHAISSENKIRFYLPDGPEQRERDARMAGGSTDFALKAVEWIYSHGAGRVEDAVRV
jgi:hypothetical protein